MRGVTVGQLQPHGSVGATSGSVAFPPRLHVCASACVCGALDGSSSSMRALGLACVRCLSSVGSYLVDPASSHMLVSKIKPCMSKYKRLYTVKLRMAHYISYSLFDNLLLLG